MFPCVIKHCSLRLSHIYRMWLRPRRAGSAALQPSLVLSMGAWSPLLLYHHYLLHCFRNSTNYDRVCFRTLPPLRRPERRYRSSSLRVSRIQTVSPMPTSESKTSVKPGQTTSLPGMPWACLFYYLRSSNASTIGFYASFRYWCTLAPTTS
jgi:hypothetical protein